jgi:hypothetical protein
VPSAETKPHVKNSQTNFDEQTISLIERYFRVEDRDALLKYLRDTVAASAESLK